ncbi:hypothetical protein MMC12_007371 [Toensbergia leucococca]|nr:hypothetical protein [Toensbergia leucococca]
MSETQELTYAEVAEHSSKKSLYLVVHDKIYNVTEFIDEHPGGEEVLLDVGGQDATEAFEDVGHSDEAREILQGLLVAPLKRQDGDPHPKVSSSSAPTATSTSSGSAGLGVVTYAIVLLGAVMAFAAWKYLAAKEGE